MTHIPDPEYLFFLYQSPTPSCESLGDLPHRALVYLKEFSQRGLIALKTYRDEFKIGELADYVMSNAEGLSSFYSYKYAPLPNTTFDHPAGMRTTYLNTVTTLFGLASSLTEFFTQHDIVAQASRAFLAPDGARALETLFHRQGPLYDRVIIQTRSTLDTLFAPNNPLTVGSAQKLFKNRSDLKLCQDNLLRVDEFYRTASRTSQKFKTALTLIDTTVSKAEAHPPHRDSVMYYTSIIGNTAKLYELYGMVLNLLQQLEFLFTRSLIRIVNMSRPT